MRTRRGAESAAGYRVFWGPRLLKLTVRFDAGDGKLMLALADTLAK